MPGRLHVVSELRSHVCLARAYCASPRFPTGKIAFVSPGLNSGDINVAFEPQKRDGGLEGCRCRGRPRAETRDTLPNDGQALRAGPSSSGVSPSSPGPDDVPRQGNAPPGRAPAGSAPAQGSAETSQEARAWSYPKRVATHQSEPRASAPRQVAMTPSGVLLARSRRFQAPPACALRGKRTGDAAPHPSGHRFARVRISARATQGPAQPRSSPPMQATHEGKPLLVHAQSLANGRDDEPDNRNSGERVSWMTPNTLTDFQLAAVRS
jgi:hypothetical protein